MTPLSPYDPEIETVWRELAATGARSVAVVSAMPGEGTTMIASALARRAGLAGPPSLLVDLNLTRPGIARLLGLRPKPGEIVTLDALGLGVLADVSAANADEWRESAALVRQLYDWRQDWGMVVLDTVPVLSRDVEAMPAATAAAAADATILVAMAGVTPANAIAEARDRLIGAGAKMIGTILNDRDNPSLLTELERETYRFASLLPKAMAALRARFRRNTLLGVRV